MRKKLLFIALLLSFTLGGAYAGTITPATTNQPKYVISNPEASINGHTQVLHDFYLFKDSDCRELIGVIKAGTAIEVLHSEFRYYRTAKICDASGNVKVSTNYAMISYVKSLGMGSRHRAINIDNVKLGQTGTTAPSFTLSASSVAETSNLSASIKYGDYSIKDMWLGVYNEGDVCGTGMGTVNPLNKIALTGQTSVALAKLPAGRYYATIMGDGTSYGGQVYFTVTDVAKTQKIYVEDTNAVIGNTVRVHVRIKEGNKERIQVFEGIVIKKQGGGVNATFTVRKISYGVGVEKTFLVHSPAVEKVEVTCPLHCREDFISGKSLNETGIYCYETVYVDDYENDCKQKLLDDVIKKNNKSTYDNSVTLLVVFDDYHFLPSNKLKDVQFIDSIFKELRKINYIFKNVYILMDKYDGSNLKYDSYLIQIK